MDYRLSRRDLLLGASAGLMLPFVGQSPTRRYVEDGYDFDETSEEWKVMCQALPCFAALHWPDYSTKLVEDRINGQAVVIQLWKGFCPQFLNLANMPGGTGAEVGIYRRIPGKEWSRPAMFPLPLFEKLRAMAGSSELWWPAPELKTEVDWELINPDTREVFYRAGKQVTYWRNKWMENGSYARYKLTHKAPALAWNYTLKYTVNSKTYPTW